LAVTFPYLLWGAIQTNVEHDPVPFALIRPTDLAVCEVMVG
jgi:hypothetical protein